MKDLIMKIVTDGLLLRDKTLIGIHSEAKE